jgi:Fe-S-cluster-containing dehydrogenase component
MEVFSKERVMSMDRKLFLKITGCAVASAIAGHEFAGIVAEAQDGAISSNPDAITAKRWGMVVDTRKCLKADGCDKCMTACHQTHNVPDIESKAREVKWIWKESYEHAFAKETEYPSEELEHRDLLVFCNHCDEPPCVRVCPTQATWKRESDGIVMMDWHRCIGCRYCVAACPYGSRSFNWSDPRPHIERINAGYPTRSKGVVEKCTFCDERLAQGLMPACVEACPEKALVFGDLSDPNSEVRQLIRSQRVDRRKPELGTKPEVFYIL